VRRATCECGVGSGEWECECECECGVHRQGVPRHHRVMPGTVSVKVFNAFGQLIGPIDVPRVEKTDASGGRS